MRDGEGVVDVDVAELGECRHEFRRVFLFARMEAGVLEQRDFARLHRSDGFLRLRPDAVESEGDGTAEDLRELGRHRRQRLRGIAPFGPAEVRKQNGLAALADDVAHGGQRGDEARIVADPAVLDRHVEIHAHEHALTGQVRLIERTEVRHSCPRL